MACSLIMEAGGSCSLSTRNLMVSKVFNTKWSIITLGHNFLRSLKISWLCSFLELEKNDTFLTPLTLVMLLLLSLSSSLSSDEDEDEFDGESWPLQQQGQHLLNNRLLLLGIFLIFSLHVINLHSFIWHLLKADHHHWAMNQVHTHNKQGGQKTWLKSLFKWAIYQGNTIFFTILL